MTRSHTATGSSHPLGSDKRAAAHTMGYVLVVSIFLVGGLVLFTGAMSLFDMSQKSDGLGAAETEMNKLRTTISQLVDGAPSRSTSISGTDVSLSHTGDQDITVSVWARLHANYDPDPDNDGNTYYGEYPAGCTPSKTNFCNLIPRSDELNINPLVYATSDGQVSYIEGALVSNSNEGPPHVSTPPVWDVGTYHARIPVIAPTPAPSSPSSYGVGGSTHSMNVEMSKGTVVAERWTTQTTQSNDYRNLRVVVKMENLNYDQASALKRHFEEESEYTVCPSSNGGNCGNHRTQLSDDGNANDVLAVKFTTDRVLVRHVPVSVTLGSG